MFFSDKLDLISLDFVPQKACFSKAQIEWRGILLNGKTAEDKPIVDLSDENLTELVFELFGPLEFIEMAELYQSIQKIEALNKAMNWSQFFSEQKLAYQPRTLELFDKLLQLSEDFKSWASSRKLSASDLMPINSLKDLDLFNSLSPLFSELQFTRSEGKKLIDLLVDLILLGKTKSELLPQEKQNWIFQLSEMRYPNTTQMDMEQKSSHWPEFVQVQNKRLGDRLTYNMQIQYTDAKDLNQKLNRLSELSLG